MKLFYVDLLRGKKVAFLAGPFLSEPVARKYEKEAFNAACGLDPFAAFDAFGVVGVPDDVYNKPGKVNHLIEIDPADLVAFAAA